MQVIKTLLAGSFAAAASPLFAADAAPAAALTPAQQAEVRALVQEVLADADNRSSLANGATAGIDDSGKVYLRSEDDKFEMNIGGKIQFRYDWNNHAETAGKASDEGFEMRRVDLTFSGHIGDPRVSYLVTLATGLPGAAAANGVNPNTVTLNTIGVKDAYAEYEIVDGLTVRAGKFTLPYSREALISDGAQVAVERSSVNNYFSIDRAEGVQLQWTDGSVVNLRGAISNGENTQVVTSGYANPVNVAASGRADFLIATGEKTGLNDFNDNFALSDGGKQGLLLGAAAYYENLNGSVPAVSNRYGVTGDGTFKIANLAFYGAGFVAGNDTINRSILPWGLLAQADVALTSQIDVFGQYNYINDDSPANGPGQHKDLQELVAGANYKLNSHVKLTGDVVYVFQGASAFNSPFNTGAATTAQYPVGGGLVPSSTGEVAVRAQVQVSF
jgi:hypothetical protein